MSLLFLATILTTSLLQINGASPGCRSGYSLWRGRCYRIGTVTTSWHGANDICRRDGQGSKLTSVGSQEEQDWIFRRAPAGWPYIYIGGTDSSSEGVWRWLDGQAWWYSNWYTAGGEPNNAGGDANCLEMVVGWGGKWNDKLCNEAKRAIYVCSYVPKDCRSGYQLWNGKCYRIGTVTTSWHGAKDICRSDGQGSELTSVESQEEQDWITDNAPAGWNYIYIGGTDSSSEGAWRWLDGQPWFYTNWYTAGGEPNNAGGDANCLEMIGDWGGKWNDKLCNEAAQAVYVCSYVL